MFGINTMQINAEQVNLIYFDFDIESSNIDLNITSPPLSRELPESNSLEIKTVEKKYF